ncbi:MAG: RAMP superfamily protein, partial [Coleofasciculus sp. C2-GNP5-27]
MKPIPNAYKKVPMMFRDQIRGRSQLHYIDPHKEKQDVQYWAEEWMEKAEFIPLTHSDDSQNPTDQTK